MPRKLTVEGINAALSNPETGVRLLLRGDKLALRATLPPRPGSARNRPAQTTIALGVYATPSGLEYARARAFDLASELSRSAFEWSHWSAIALAGQVETAAHWIDRYHQHRLLTLSEDNWLDYDWRFFKRIPGDRPLTQELLAVTLKHWQIHSPAREIAIRKFTKLAAFAQIECDLSPYKGKPAVKRRDLPTDAQIQQVIDSIRRRDWQWIVGAIATYGLRDHEAWMCHMVEIDGMLWCRVDEDTKTGARDVPPLYPEWVDRWNLREVERPVFPVRKKRDYSARCAAQFRPGRWDLGFPLYALRHAWCVRASITFKLPDRTAADYAGHSTKLHADLYQRYARPEQHKAAYRRAIADGPAAPE
ncbi:hypothetical protein [Thermoleptolyngbya sp. M55_K2018_002]|uniref:hypothetical protein n=1 Tax=Thermoleptolyngbya sp. M55_K2018_002 TaxID=2747808 RepID=UPI0019DC1FE8|nr:hypothetical protein [Thermoleptolyngbya sp. M55_K2018_002]HIK42127.1 hypothetical protein [Thermoleptolyngbya sp. M55_K2018_002]